MSEASNLCIHSRSSTEGFFVARAVVTGVGDGGGGGGGGGGQRVVVVVVGGGSAVLLFTVVIVSFCRC